MVSSKKTLFSESQQETAEIFRLLGHPARILILEILGQKGECHSGELAAAIPLGRSTVNQHLNELAGAGLIRRSQHGSHVIYQIDKDRMKKAARYTKVFWKSMKNKKKEGK